MVLLSLGSSVVLVGVFSLLLVVSVKGFVWLSVLFSLVVFCIACALLYSLVLDFFISLS